MTPAARRGMLILAQQALVKSSVGYDKGCDLLLKVLNDWTYDEVYKKPDCREEKQALKQRLIDAFHEHYARKMQVPMIYKEVIELIEKEFSDK